MPNKNKEEFLLRLRKLLEEYSTTIEFDCSPGSDTNGIYEGCIVINHRPNPKSFKEEEWFRTEYSWSLSKDELE